MGNYMRQREGKPPMKASRNLVFGSGFHELVLEPDEFDLYKYTGSERFKMMKMQEELNKKLTDRDREAIKVGKKEAEYFYSYLGFFCKKKEDFRSVDHSVIGDLKTTAAENEADFLKAALEYGYHRQAAWYLDAPEAVDAGLYRFVIYAISKGKNPKVFRFELDRDHDLYKEGVHEYRMITDLMRADPSCKKYLLDHAFAST